MHGPGIRNSAPPARNYECQARTSFAAHGERCTGLAFAIPRQRRGITNARPVHRRAELRMPGPYIFRRARRKMHGPGI
eukprot:54081-Lingulodinium_polyedra.AAC.1